MEVAVVKGRGEKENGGKRKQKRRRRKKNLGRQYMVTEWHREVVGSQVGWRQHIARAGGVHGDAAKLNTRGLVGVEVR